MKRVIRANKYSDKTKTSLRHLSILGDVLGRVAKADSDEEMREALSEVGILAQYVRDKAEAIQELVDMINDYGNKYLKGSNAENALPEVKKTLIDYLNGLGYNLTKLHEVELGVDEGYVIIPADECDFQDLKTVASAVSNDFNLKPDTGIIGGSWTSYQFVMDGVQFRIGFNRDYDFDPQGGEDSLQLTF